MDLVQSFGPIAFGLFSVLVIWRHVVLPELDKQKLILNQVERITNTANETARANERAAAELRQTLDSARRFWVTEQKAAPHVP
jgi:hypothetical protein